MEIMIFALFGASAFGLLIRIFKEENKNLQSIYFALISLGILICIAGFRTNIGDTITYIGVYEKTGDRTLIEILENSGDWGFYLFTYMLYQISKNPQFMIFVMAFLTQVMYFKFFLNYRTYLELEIYIYIASGYYFISMNGIRQSLAAGLVALSVKYIIDNNKIKFTLSILFASILHQSAIIMIPIFFIARMKPWSKKLFIMIGIAVLGTILFYELLPVLDRILKDTNYHHYVKAFTEDTGNGANVMRLLVSLVPPVLAFMVRDKLDDSTFTKVFLNLSIINAIFMLFAMRTWIFARFTIYFNMFNCILLPYIISKWDNKKEKRLLYLGVIIFYLLFFLREQETAERIKFIFFNR